MRSRIRSECKSSLACLKLQRTCGKEVRAALSDFVSWTVFLKFIIDGQLGFNSLMFLRIGVCEWKKDYYHDRFSKCPQVPSFFSSVVARRCLAEPGTNSSETSPIRFLSRRRSRLADSATRRFPSGKGVVLSGSCGTWCLDKCLGCLDLVAVICEISLRSSLLIISERKRDG